MTSTPPNPEGEGTSDNPEPHTPPAQGAPGWQGSQPGAGGPYGQPAPGSPYGQPDPGQYQQHSPYQQYPASPYQQYPASPYQQYPAQGPYYASWGKRALGWIFDYLLPGIVISWLAAYISPSWGFSATGELVGQTNWSQPLMQLGLFLGLAAYSAQTGQTWGRKIAKTQLVGEDGRPIGLARGFVRYLAHIVDSLILLIGWFFPIWDAKRQTIADKLMKTYVLDVSATGPINVRA